VNFFNALINVFLTHQAPRVGEYGVSYSGSRDVWGIPPVQYRKLKTHYKRIINNNCRHSYHRNLLAFHQNNYLFTVVVERQLQFSYLNSFSCQITVV